jgi:hypothetical protein
MYFFRSANLPTPAILQVAVWRVFDATRYANSSIASQNLGPKKAPFCARELFLGAYSESGFMVLYFFSLFKAFFASNATCTLNFLGFFARVLPARAVIFTFTQVPDFGSSTFF